MLKRALTLAIVVGAFLAVTAAPASAGVAVVLDGEAECTAPGTYTITWTFTLNFFGAEAEVDSAVLSGAAEGDITSSFTPNPFGGDDDISIGSSEVSGDTVGTVTLDAVLTVQTKGSFEIELSDAVELDGSCEAPPTTEEPTTTSTAAVAPDAAVRPTFTG